MKNLRALEIVDFLQEQKVCSMTDLMEHFQVSQATIHRDVMDLAKKKLISKVHGGVAVNSVMPQQNESGNSHFSTRINKNIQKKLLIADKAVEHIQDGDIIFLDSSTTVLHLARKIQKLQLTNLTVITNSVHIIQEFCLFPPHFVLVGLGGNYNCQLNSFLGKSAVEGLQRLRISKVFISAVGATIEGVTTYHEDHAEFLAKAMALSVCKYLLLDSTKFDRTGLFKFAELKDFDIILSDCKPIACYMPSDHLSVVHHLDE